MQKSPFSGDCPHVEKWYNRMHFPLCTCYNPTTRVQTCVHLTNLLVCLVQDHTLELNLEPFHGVLLRHAVLNAHSGLASAAPGDTVTRSLQHDKEVHTVNASGGIISARSKKEMRTSPGTPTGQ